MQISLFVSGVEAQQKISAALASQNQTLRQTGGGRGRGEAGPRPGHVLRHEALQVIEGRLPQLGDQRVQRVLRRCGGGGGPGNNGHPSQASLTDPSGKRREKIWPAHSPLRGLKSLNGGEGNCVPAYAFVRWGGFSPE